MKILKFGLYALLGTLAAVLIVAAFAPKEYTVEREVSINQPKDAVFAYIKLLKNQDDFSVWANIDPKMKKSFRGTDGTLGFVSAWESEHEQVGRGEQEIVGMVEGERIDYELRFFEPWESTAPAYMSTEALSDTQTRVRWGFSGKMDYPMNLMLVFMDMEEMIGKDLSTGLNSLKNKMEQ